MAKRKNIKRRKKILRPHKREGMNKLMPNQKTKLQVMIDGLDISQAKLSRLSSIKKYQISLIASGTRPDCYLSTANRICQALSKVAKRRITLDELFGIDQPFR